MAIERKVDSRINAAISSVDAMLDIMSSSSWLVEKILVPNHRIVGVLVSEQKAVEHVYLSDLSIHPRVHGKGYGRTALKKFLVRHDRVKRIDLLTHEENAKALRLYGSFGFRRESAVPNAFGDGQTYLLLVRNVA